MIADDDGERLVSHSNGRTTASGGWKIDELAHLSGISVDTIRYYSREGLLPDAQRDGRGLIYGPSHLERLKQIRQLQEKHISLAAIRDLLDEGVWSSSNDCSTGARRN